MESKKGLYDKFGRKHDYLRISLTERCNLRCTYCMPEDGIQLRDRAEFMTAEETIEIAKTFIDLGIKKIRLTGGEPLIKKNFAMILNELSKFDIEIALTTNGILVDKYLEDFNKANIRTINLSIDSLKEDRFNAISRREYFTRVMANLNLLLQENFKVKVNAVIMKGVNDDEVIDFINWTKDLPIDVRFIEFMPFDGNQWNWEKKVSFEEIMNQVNAKFNKEDLIKLEEAPNATSRGFKIKGFKGSFGIISSVTNPFCDTCNRIRLTADGKIKNCLFSSNELDLLGALRANKPILPLIEQSLQGKKKERAGITSFEDQDSQKIHASNRSMISIGG